MTNTQPTAAHRTKIVHQYLKNNTQNVRVLPCVESPNFFREFATKSEFVSWKQELYKSFAYND
jgi:hypothetical protein